MANRVIQLVCSSCHNYAVIQFVKANIMWFTSKFAFMHKCECMHHLIIDSLVICVIHSIQYVTPVALRVTVSLTSKKYHIHRQTTKRNNPL